MLSVSSAPLGSSVPVSVSPVVALAQCYFQLKEYRRAVHCLREESSAIAVFLKNYALFMVRYWKDNEAMQAGEKEKEEALFESNDAAGNQAGTKLVTPHVEAAVPSSSASILIPDSTVFTKFRNKELRALELTLSTSKFCSSEPDAFCLYLYSVVLHALSKNEVAREYLVHSVNLMPYNWSAWLLLVELCPDGAVATSLALNNHWMRDFFFVEMFSDSVSQVNIPLSEEEIIPDQSKASLVAGKNSALLQSSLNRVVEAFPNSSHVLATKAMIQYNAREFEIAQSFFEQLRQKDPFRLENLDTFSNLLYIKESSAALSFLAQSVFKIDKYRSETCIIIGNYYSLKQNHSKALIYFRRALRLSPNYLAAWTLLGHELVELRNTSGAIEAYRRAVDINPRDFRAWYGLGQTYEMLQMFSFALYYYQRAAALRPFDSRMWCAMAESYEKLGRTHDSIRCYLRADESNKDQEGLALAKLGALYAGLIGEDNQAKAAMYYRRLLLKEPSSSTSPEIIEARTFLGEFCKRQLQVALVCNNVVIISNRTTIWYWKMRMP